jgi:hypothetical protein
MRRRYESAPPASGRTTVAVGVIKATLADIKPGLFVGIAAMPQPDGTQRALEVLIFPGDGSGLVLFWKRLEHGAFRWPPISDGIMRLTASQLAALVDGMDWSRLHARDVARPTATS